MVKPLIFTDNYFIVSYHILYSRKVSWSVRSFQKCGISKGIASVFLQYLIKNDILYRNNAVGSRSYCMLKSPKALLNLCVKHFVQPDKKRLCFITTRNTAAILKDLKRYNIELYLSKFSGIKSSLRYVHDNSLHVNIPNLDFFKHERISIIEKELNIHRINSGGNIFIYLPRYRKFLKHACQQYGGFAIPSDFYTYLEMMNLANPRGQEQADYMLKKLKGKAGSFLG